MTFRRQSLLKNYANAKPKFADYVLSYINMRYSEILINSSLFPTLRHTNFQDKYYFQDFL